MKLHIEVTSPQIIVKKVFVSEILVWALEYFVALMLLYNRLQDDYKLHGLKTRTALKSKVSKLDEVDFLGDIFSYRLHQLY